MTSQEIIDEILTYVNGLTEVPLVAMKANQLLDNPNSTARQLAEVIMMDPALTTKVLRLCNSAQYGFARKVDTISEAVSILGVKELKKMMFTVLFHSVLNRPVIGYALEKGALWENSVYCGVYARHIAKALKFPEEELTFVGGMLRDIGKVALERYIRQRGVVFTELVNRDKCSFDQAEEKIIGVSHTEVGAAIAKQWNLPDTLTMVVTYHHQPSQMPEDTAILIKKLVSLVHLGDIFTMMTGKGIGLDGLMYPLDPIVFEHLNIQKDSGFLDKMFAEISVMKDEIAELSGAFTADAAR